MIAYHPVRLDQFVEADPDEIGKLPDDTMLALARQALPYSDDYFRDREREDLFLIVMVGVSRLARLRRHQ